MPAKVEPEDIWSDGVTMWVLDGHENKIYAYDMATQARVPGKDLDFDKALSFYTWPASIWSDGATMWVGDNLQFDSKIYAFQMPDSGGP